MAAIFGFTGIAAVSVGIAKVLFFVFLVMFLVTLSGVFCDGHISRGSVPYMGKLVPLSPSKRPYNHGSRQFDWHSVCRHPPSPYNPFLVVSGPFVPEDY